MLFKIPLTFLTLLMQGAGAGPPEPKMGPLPPPPGLQVPIDENIWILIAGAILIGVWFFYKKMKEKEAAKN